jgi:hypothetical protein
MEELLNYRQKLLEMLQNLPGTYQQTLAHLSPEQVHQTLPGDSATIHQVAVHVRDAAQDTYLPIITTLLETSQTKNASLPEAGTSVHHYTAGEPIQQVCTSMRQLQSQMLDSLQASPHSAWSAAMRHPAWGVRTLQWWVEQYLAHGRAHLHQIRSHLDAVNPTTAS